MEHIYGTIVSYLFNIEMRKLGALGALSFGPAIRPYIYLIPVYLLSRRMPYGEGKWAFCILVLPIFMFIFIEAAALGIGVASIIRQSKPRALGIFAVLLYSAYLIGIISIVVYLVFYLG